jgi:excisionase family DNA binding protein
MKDIRREWLTYREAKELVGLSRTKLWELISDCEVRATKAGKAVRIDRRSLEDWMRQHPFAEG